MQGSSGIFTFAASWSLVRTPSSVVDWHNMVWCPKNVPKVVACLKPFMIGIKQETGCYSLVCKLSQDVSYATRKLRVGTTYSLVALILPLFGNWKSFKLKLKLPKREILTFKLYLEIANLQLRKFSKPLYCWLKLCWELLLGAYDKKEIREFFKKNIVIRWS